MGFAYLHCILALMSERTLVQGAPAEREKRRAGGLCKALLFFVLRSRSYTTRMYLCTTTAIKAHYC